MKNLVTFVFIVIIFINAFDNFAFASSPANWRRLEVKFLGENGLSNSNATCPDSSYYPCSNGVGCCPIGSDCLSSNTCSGGCTSEDVFCSNGKTCCKKGQYCGFNNLCYVSTSTTTTTPTTTNSAITLDSAFGSKLMAILTISLTLAYLIFLLGNNSLFTSANWKSFYLTTLYEIDHIFF
ncbi:hypothetical protein Glove_184g26 [Diversispora epigaea]|uniref:Granulins domain-containing protein n=1 Tax=Diversispora epigaea TaxID=1348612 RepID=A0A397IMR2_9GLOM|nr:hypothetical protein Glove_184g26 [Diversispora epigaea]